MWECMWVCAYECLVLAEAKGLDLPEPGLTGACELPDVGPGNQLKSCEGAECAFNF